MMINNLIPANLSRLVDDIRDEVNHGLDRALQSPRASRGKGGGSGSKPSVPGGFLWDAIAPGVFGAPAMDIEEHDDEFVVTAELPGVAKDDFSIEIVGDELRIAGEKRDHREEKRDGAYVSERSYGRFSRSVSLPCEVVRDKTSAKLKDGVLTVTLPKAPSAKNHSHRVEVK